MLFKKRASPVGLVWFLTEYDLRVVPVPLTLTLGLGLGSEGLIVLQPTQLPPSEMTKVYSLGWFGCFWSIFLLFSKRRKKQNSGR